MHELGVATELYRVCRLETRRRGGRRLHAVTVEIGELAGVEPDLLRYAWEAIIADGPDHGATLSIRWCPAQQTCDDCGAIAERAPGSWLRLCPRCERPLVVAGGDELDVREIEFTTETAPLEILS